MRSIICALSAAVLAAVALTTPNAAQAAAPVPSSHGLWISTAEAAKLPMSGSGWTNLKATADGALGTPNVADQSSTHPVRTFGVALVYARTGDPKYREKARAAIMSAIGTEAGARSLAVGRNLAPYVLAADLINLDNLSAADGSRFRGWISGMRTRVNTGNSKWTTLNITSERTANNWGTFANASRIAIDRYLGDTADLQVAAQIHRSYVDRAAYPAGRSWGRYFEPTADFDPKAWACGDATNWTAVNPPCVKNGYDIGGAFVEDISRETAGVTQLPQPSSSAGVSYSWEALQGVSFQAELLRRAGLPSLWELGNNALLRATQFIQRAGWYEQYTVTKHVPWLINKHYGGAFPCRYGGMGRVVGFTDWTHPY